MRTFLPRRISFQPAGPRFVQCRVCGCTNHDCRQCVEATGDSCWWVGPYLCSRCLMERSRARKRPLWLLHLLGWRPAAQQQDW